MFIFKDSATGNFKAAQWYSIPNDDLTMNLTGVTFGGYDAYNPGITLPRVYKLVKPGQTVAFHSAIIIVLLKCNVRAMGVSPEKAVDQLPNDWDAERFTVVDAQWRGCFPLSAIVLCVWPDGWQHAVVDSYQIIGNGRFTLVDAFLHCKAWNFVRMSGVLCVWNNNREGNGSSPNV